MPLNNQVARPEITLSPETVATIPCTVFFAKILLQFDQRQIRFLGRD